MCVPVPAFSANSIETPQSDDCGSQSLATNWSASRSGKSSVNARCFLVSFVMQISSNMCVCVRFLDDGICLFHGRLGSMWPLVCACLFNPSNCTSTFFVHFFHCHWYSSSYTLVATVFARQGESFCVKWFEGETTVEDAAREWNWVWVCLSVLLCMCRSHRCRSSAMLICKKPTRQWSFSRLPFHLHPSQQIHNWFYYFFTICTVHTFQYTQLKWITCSLG